ncbi:MAG: YicC family protein [Flavobacteriales bacterium]|nr:YicC family protein [Flavobacteriales bacterium]MDW8410885.1 YicC/YloC family endoribonuclease [Flavobacteriales bacterium]
MTGFGKAVVQAQGLSVTAEIRSLNSKTLDLNLRLPRQAWSVEGVIRQQISAALVRGKVDATIQVHYTELKENNQLNLALLRAYLRELRRICEEEAIPQEGLLEAVMQIPGLVESEPRELNAEEREALMKALENALNAVISFRRREGEAMAQSIAYLLEKLEFMRQRVEELAGKRKEYIRNRLREALLTAELREAMDENRLEQEIIFYLEKSDIHEEILRMQAHLSHFAETMRSDGPVGRKLSFIAQEIGREINTIGAKAADAEIQKLVTEMKEDLEKIKELLLNVL